MKRLRTDIDRLGALLAVSEPVTYRDAWRHSILVGIPWAASGVVHFAVGNLPMGTAMVTLALPVMAAFTFGFAVRRNDHGAQLFSLAVGLLVAGILLPIPPVRAGLLATGPAGLLLLWVIVLVGLFGYAYPDYGPW